jgi:DNA polymerase III delta prime subunit
MAKEFEIWAEKYRPSKVDDLIDQEHVKERVKIFLKEKNLPHMLFAGPPGTGKTTLALIIAKELYGEQWKANVLELNASVSKDTPILVKINGKIKKTNFEELDKLYFKNKEEEYKNVSNLEVLTVDKNLKVKWAKVSKIIRHRADKILRIKFEGGEIKLTGNHSVMVLTDKGLKAISASKLKEEDYLISFNTSKYFDYFNEIYFFNIGYNNFNLELLPSKIFSNIFRIAREEVNKERIAKSFGKEILENVNEGKLNKKERLTYEFLKKLTNSELHVLKIKKIEMIKYNDFVYDVSVPNNEMFFAGNVPILLHNSDERGIDVIRGKVKEFARTKAIGEVPFKLIIMDEADALTQEAQQALRRMMEDFAGVTRFILCCNYSSKIIEPIQSRCAVFRFKALPENAQREFIQRIVKGEKLQIDEEAIQAVLSIAEGDLRKVANLLQAAAAISKKITAEIVYDVASRAKPKEVEEMLNLALKGDAQSFQKARELLHKKLIVEGLAGEDLIKEIYRQALKLNIPDDKKIELIEKIGEYEFRISEGGDALIQLTALLAQIALIGKKK